MSRNKFICFEGVDGSGKSTLAHLLAKELPALYLHNPPDSIIPIRKNIYNYPPSVRYHYYLLGNLITSAEVDQLITSSSVVLDRYFYSTRAFHAPFFEKEMVLPEMRKPDLIIYVSASWDEIERRLASRPHRKSSENIHYLQSVAKEYDRLFSNNPSILKIDTTGEEPNNLITKIVEVINGTRN